MDIHIREQVSRPAVWFIVGAMALLGVALTVGGLIGLPDAEAAVPLVIGVGVLGLTGRLSVFLLRPRLSLTDRELIVRRFWGRERRFPFDGTTGWATEIQRIEKNWTGRRLIRPVTVERLVRTGTDGAVEKVVLPRFAGANERILTELAKRSGIGIEARGPIAQRHR